MFAAQILDLVLGQLRQVSSLEQDLAADDFARVLKQSDDGKAGHALAGTALADQSDDLAFANLKVRPSRTLAIPFG